MKNNYRQDLLKELNQEGVSQKDAEELLQTAFSLSKLSTIRRSYEFKKLQAKKISSQKLRGRLFFEFPRILIPIFAVLVLLLGSSSVVLAQKSLPGNPLYPVKRLSENIAVSINPKFKEEIKNRREKEVKELHEQEKNFYINKAEKHQEQKEEKNDEKNVKSEKDIKQIDNSENKSSQKNSEVTKELNQIKEKEGTSKNEEKEVKGINTENPSSNKDHDEEKESGKEKKN